MTKGPMIMIAGITLSLLVLTPVALLVKQDGYNHSNRTSKLM